MAGGWTNKADPKKKFNKFGQTSEVLQDSRNDSIFPQPKVEKPLFKLSGILGLNQTVEISRPENKSLFTNHLLEEEKTLFDQRQKQLQKEIRELQEEIKKLVRATDNLGQNVEIAAANQVAEASYYQINFFQRIRNLIITIRQNISQSALWFESFTAKKKKRNFFWNQVKSKKGGGEQYLFSNEHSAARSAT